MLLTQVNNIMTSLLFKNQIFSTLFIQFFVFIYSCIWYSFQIIFINIFIISWIQLLFLKCENIVFWWISIIYFFNLFIYIMVLRFYYTLACLNINLCRFYSNILLLTFYTSGTREIFYRSSVRLNRKNSRMSFYSTWTLYLVRLGILFYCICNLLLLLWLAR